MISEKRTDRMLPSGRPTEGARSTMITRHWAAACDLRNCVYSLVSGIDRAIQGTLIGARRSAAATLAEGKWQGFSSIQIGESLTKC
jgi:hypothetical protein